MAENPDDKLSVVFREGSKPNKAKSQEQGRPVHDPVEYCEIRTPGDRESLKVFPAHAFCRWIVNQDGEQEKQTYAMRFSAQYRRFKEGRQQVQEGTPLSELPFLNEARRSELKALNIYTAEQLADPTNIKGLGMGGRADMEKAQAYLDAASGSADVTAMAAKIADLEAVIAQMQGEPANTEQPKAEGYAGWEDDRLKDHIAEKSGQRPRGNPNHDTLVRMAEELDGETATEAA